MTSAARLLEKRRELSAAPQGLASALRQNATVVRYLQTAAPLGQMAGSHWPWSHVCTSQ